MSQLTANSPERSRTFKRDQRYKYVTREGLLDAESAKALHQLIPADSPVETMHAVEKGVREGDFKLLTVFENEKPIGFTVYAITEGDAGKEFLSVASYAKGRGDVTGKVMPQLEQLAKEKGCKSIRLHTMRTGLVEKLRNDLGWFVSEIVMRKEIH